MLGVQFFKNERRIYMEVRATEEQREEKKKRKRLLCLVRKFYEVNGDKQSTADLSFCSIRCL